MTFLIVLVVAFSAFVLGYAIAGADRDDKHDEAVRALEELRRIHEEHRP